MNRSYERFMNSVPHIHRSSSWQPKLQLKLKLKLKLKPIPTSTSSSSTSSSPLLRATPRRPPRLPTRRRLLESGVDTLIEAGEEEEEEGEEEGAQGEEEGEEEGGKEEEEGGSGRGGG